MRVYFLILCLWNPILCNEQKKPILLWDLHNVFFVLNNPVKTMLSYPYLIQVITHTHRKLLQNIASMLIKNIWIQTSSEDYLKIAEFHKNPYLKELILSISNSIRFIPSMDHLVQEIATLGYEQHIGSNIGPSAFEQLTNPSYHPEFTHFFSLFNIPSSQIAEYENDILISKPQLHFFTKYLKKNNLDPYKQHIIFIDDNRENINTAKTLGFDTILFKHPYALRNELRKKGIFIKAPPYTISHQWAPSITNNKS